VICLDFGIDFVVLDATLGVDGSVDYRLASRH
jgi:hypothetical protein